MATVRPFQAMATLFDIFDQKGYLQENVKQSSKTTKQSSTDSSATCLSVCLLQTEDAPLGGGGGVKIGDFALEGASEAADVLHMCM